MNFTISSGFHFLTDVIVTLHFNGTIQNDRLMDTGHREQEPR